LTVIDWHHRRRSGVLDVSRGQVYIRLLGWAVFWYVKTDVPAVMAEVREFVQSAAGGN
jgi:hypothetical protein